MMQWVQTAEAKYVLYVGQLFRVSTHDINDIRNQLREPSGYFQTQLLKMFIERFEKGDLFRTAIKTMAIGNVTVFSFGENLGKAYFNGKHISIDGAKRQFQFLSHHDVAWKHIIENKANMDLDFVIRAQAPCYHCYPILEKLFELSFRHFTIPLISDLQHIVLEYLEWIEFRELDWFVEYVLPSWT